MFWPDRVAKEIISSKKYKPFWVDDMFTPSGYAHIGSLRGPLVHDLIFKALIKTGVKAKFTYILNDFDPVDGVPPEFEYLNEYLGLPLKKTPAPKGSDFANFGDFIAMDMKNTLKKLGVEPEYLSSWEMYHQGKFDSAIRLALDAASEIAEIYHQVSGSEKRGIGWYPLSVICERCGRVGTTRVYDWDGETVAYKCEPNMVTWAKGCDYEGRISPFGGNGKLPWKVDWPAHWMVLGVTIEGAGKDHSVAGSSRDVARQLCKRVFKIEEPYNLPYEFLTIGGKKMSSSKGLGLKAHDLFDILPAEMARFLYTRTDYRQEVDFNPFGTMSIPDLFDEYDRCYLAYIENTNQDFAKAFEFAHIGELPQKSATFLPRFRDVVNYIQQTTLDVRVKFEEIKGGALNEVERKLLEEREKYAKIWLEKYAPEEFKLGMSEKLPEVGNLTKGQKEYLSKAADLVERADDPEKLQLELYNLSKQMGFKAKDCFAAIYTAMIGKEYGPKAGHFLMQYSKDKVIQRLKEAAGLK